MCKEIKPLHDFSPGKNGKPHSYCKPCYKSWAHENYLKNREARLARQKKRRLENWDHVRQVETSSQAKNRLRRNKTAREWAQRNPDKRKLYAQNWRAKNKELVVDASHRRRAKIRQVTTAKVTKADMQAIMRKPCIYCGAKAQQVDHVIPLARGGSHSIGNLAPSCAPCNQSKKALFVIEWKAKRRDIGHRPHLQHPTKCFGTDMGILESANASGF